MPGTGGKGQYIFFLLLHMQFNLFLCTLVSCKLVAGCRGQIWFRFDFFNKTAGSSMVYQQGALSPVVVLSVMLAAEMFKAWIDSLVVAKWCYSDSNNSFSFINCNTYRDAFTHLSFG